MTDARQTRSRDPARDRGEPRDGLRTGGPGPPPVAAGREPRHLLTRGRARGRQGRLRVGRRRPRGRARHADDTAQQILKATALIAKDKGLHKAAGKQLAAGKGPANAITAAVEEYAAQFEALGGYFAERVTDLRDVGSTVRSPPCSGKPAPGRARLHTSPASSSPRTSHPPRRPPSTGRWSSASSPRPAVARATRRSSPPRWASRPSCSAPERPASRSGTTGRCRR
jgi:hypothetical protein